MLSPKALQRDAPSVMKSPMTKSAALEEKHVVSVARCRGREPRADRRGAYP